MLGVHGGTCCLGLCISAPSFLSFFFFLVDTFWFRFLHSLSTWLVGEQVTPTAAGVRLWDCDHVPVWERG